MIVGGPIGDTRDETRDETRGDTRDDGRRERVPVLAACLGLVLAACLALGAGCSRRGDDEARVALPVPVSEAEVERGLAACQDYIDKVCACAEARPEDAEIGQQCHMAPAKLGSLRMTAEVNRTSSQADERVATERTLRRIVRSCVESTVDLGPRGCPR